MALPTSAAFRRYYLEGRVPLVRAVLRLSDDTTVQVGGDRIMNGGLSVTGATSPSGDFSIGSAIVGTATVTLANYDGWLDLLDLEGATLLAYAGAEVAGGTEWALLGTYDVDAPTTRGMTYPLQCRDLMGRFEVAYGGVSTAYPATLATIVSDICSHVGVTLSTQIFPNSTHVVQERPTDELSCIDMLGFVAQLACCYARMTPNGQLALGWYDADAFGDESWLDGGTFAGAQTPYADGDVANGGAFMTGGDVANGGTFSDAGDYSHVSAIRSLTVGAMDVTITGVRVKAQDQVSDDGEGLAGESYLYGQEGYVLAVEGNPLVPYGSAQAVAGLIGPRVVGLTFRAVDADVIGDPSLQAGDAMVVTDRLGRTYRTYVTQATWSSGGSQRLACDTQPPSRKAMSRTGVVTRAITAIKDTVRKVTTATQAARQVADEGKALADAIGQHFWTDENGVHVTQITQESWGEAPLGPNLLANSLGMAIREALLSLVTITQSAIAFYDGLGNNAANIFASFGRAGSRIGYEGDTHVSVTETGMTLSSPSVDTGFDMGLGNRAVEQMEFMDDEVVSVPFTRTLYYTPRQGSLKVYGRDPYGPPSGEDTYSYTLSGRVVTVTDSRIVGNVPIFAYVGSDFNAAAVTVGKRGTDPTDAIGPCSSAFGYGVVASGRYSHAEGAYSKALGESSHAEGYGTAASGWYSHADGYYSEALGQSSHASGWYTVASGFAQTVIGRYNVEDLSRYALIIGNGSNSSNRSNALTVDWDGNMRVADHAYDIGTIRSDTYTMSLESLVARGICGIVLDKGVWLIEGNVSYATNATGRRAIDLSTTYGDMTQATVWQTGVQVPAASGGVTALHTTWVLNCTAQTTIYLNAYQDSGSNLSVTGNMRAVCIL